MPLLLDDLFCEICGFLICFILCIVGVQNFEPLRVVLFAYIVEMYGRASLWFCFFYKSPFI